MIAREELLSLKAKILPAGAETILDYLASKHQQVEITQIVLENVPLLIIGRHGMIARIPVGGSLQKISHPTEIMDQLRTFFARQETLYLFTNLPDLALPVEVQRFIEEVEEHQRLREDLQKQIDEALERRDRQSFLDATAALKRLQSGGQAPVPNNRIAF